MSTALCARLLALAAIHDSFAARANYKGNEKYPANPRIAEKRAHHEQAAADLRAAVEAISRPAPWEVAEEIAKAIEPKRIGARNTARGRALEWAASVARSLFKGPGS